MSLDPEYGETPLPEDELDYLTPDARAALDEPITRAAVFDIEQAIAIDVAARHLTAVRDGALTVDEMLHDEFLRRLHRELYEAIWVWAGVYRRYEVSIGVPPEHIAVQVRQGFDTVRYRWFEMTDLSPHDLGIAVHADMVRVHPFMDGNGRTTRLIADLVRAAASGDADLSVYDWDVEKRPYIERLREFDQPRDASALAGFIASVPVG